MSNINLLPEELRRREQKELEHLAKQRKVERVELNRPLPVQQGLKKESDKPKRSWLKGIFGTRAKQTAVPVKMPQPVYKSSLDVDLLAASKKKQFNYKFGAKPQDFIKAGYAGQPEKHPVRPQPQQPLPQPRPLPPPAQPRAVAMKPPAPPITPPAPLSTHIKPKAKNSFWASFFSMFAKKPKAPKPITAPKIAAAPAPLPPRVTPAPVSVAAAKPAKKEPRDSWWKILHGLFSASKKKNVAGLHLTGEHADRLAAAAHPVAVAVPAPRPTNGHKQEIKPAPQPGYHQTPPLGHSSVQVNFAKLPHTPQEPNFAVVVLVFLAAWIFPVLIVFGCSGFISQQQNKINGQLAQEQRLMAELNSQLSPYLQKQIQLDVFNGRLAALRSLLQNQDSWDNFFLMLEKYTLDDVYYKELSAESGGAVSLSALAPTFEKAAEQTAVYNNAGDFVKEVKVNEAKEVNDEKSGRIMINFLPRLNLAEGVLNNSATVK